MASVSPRRVIGIDLGTTNTVAATSTAVQSSSKQKKTTPIGAVEVVPLVQHTDLNEIERLHHLPSVLYHALPEEPFGSFTPNKPWIVGQHARRRGAEVSERVITSAKSWLCHTGVDRTAAILPWVAHSEDEAEAPRLSPVDATTAILRHVTIALEDAGQSPSNADVVVTVPASFDQVARQLTVEAARLAGLDIRLLEEPQAAFYDWLHRASHGDVDALLERRDGFVILVVDVGGGTTDLTLLRVKARDQLSAAERLTVPASELVAVERIAVGRHLLLGGDNVDLALAHLIERKLDAAKRLSPTEFSQLVATCQSAKERLLGVEPPQKIPVRLARRGSALFGNVLSSEVTRAEVEALVFDGFLPDHDQDTPVKRSRSGLLAFGLPFESDPAITHHLGQFLTQHKAEVHGVLFNGGFFKSESIARRVTRILERWMGKPVLTLPNAAPDEAVARGAVYYGLALQGNGVKFTGGSAHGYYVGVDATDGSRKAVCVVPKGAAEDEWQRVDGLPLRLTVGKAVRFDLHASAVASHSAGHVVDLDAGDFERVATVGTKLATAAPVDASGSAVSSAAKSAAKTPSSDVIPVVLQGCLTPVGTLELACEAVAPPNRRFALAFEVRAANKPSDPPSTSEGGPISAASVALPKPSAAPGGPMPTPVGGFHAAAEHLHRVFGKGRSDVHVREVKDLWRDLEQKLGPRQTWDIRLARELADELLPLAAGRRRSADHERVFFALSGFLLRPGFGYIGDAERLELLSPLFAPGLLFHGERQSWDQFFIAWRRVAAGLTEATQESIRSLCDPLLAPSELKLKKSKTFKAPEVPGLWELISWLERVSAERRAVLGQWLLDRTWTSRDPRNWEWLGRTGAREPVYASPHHVVRTRHVEAWLEHLLSEPWNAMPTAAFAAVQLARCTNDRARDVNAALRERVAKKLREVSAAEAWVESVLHYVPRTETTTSQAFGEDLPPGLTLG
jgi:molecular chaperone DnaK (HSP70)